MEMKADRLADAALKTFAGRRLVLATMHGKETVMATLLEEKLGAVCEVAVGLNTDLLGTFSGEVEREDDPLATARRKCRLAMNLAGADLAVASEGSFGPHPSLFFVPSDDEMVVLMDDKLGLEVVGRSISTQTNFSGKMVADENELKAFADSALFPSHALIVKDRKDDFSLVHKGIHDWQTLVEKCQPLWQHHGQAWVETDMRAMHNPSRLKVIAEATQKLIEKLQSFCPSCHMAGFSVVEAKPGLPCSLCGEPTRGVLSHVYRCQKCGFEEEKMYPDGKREQDPMWCDGCNP